MILKPFYEQVTLPAWFLYADGSSVFVAHFCQLDRVRTETAYELVPDAPAYREVESVRGSHEQA